MYIMLGLLFLVMHPRGYQQFDSKSLSSNEYVTKAGCIFLMYQLNHRAKCGSLKMNPKMQTTDAATISKISIAQSRIESTYEAAIFNHLFPWTLPQQYLGKYVRQGKRPLKWLNVNAGPYQLDSVYFSLCKGPKKENMTSNTISITKTPGNTYTINWNVTFLIAGPIEELRSDVYSHNKTLLYSYKVKNICKHPLGSLATNELHADRDCVVKKGSYFLKVNLSTMATMFLGPKFFYGDFVFKNIITSRKGNVFCGNQGMTFIKKTFM